MSDRGQDRLKPPLLLLIFCTMYGVVGLNILVPATPSIAEDLLTSPTLAQWTISVYLIGIAAGQLIYGPLSDRFGRRPVMLAGLVLFIITSIIGFFAASISALIVLRLVQALGGCAGTVLTRAIVRDIYSRDQAASALGYIAMTMVVGPGFAPLVGGQIDALFGWRASFIFLALFGCLLLFASSRWLHETNMHRTSEINIIGVLRDYITLLKSPSFVGYTSVVAMTGAMFFTFLASSPHLTTGYLGESLENYGLFFLCMPAGFASGNFLSGRFAVRLGAPVMIYWGMSVTFIGIVILWLAFAYLPPGFATLFGPMFVIMLGNGICQSSAIAGAISIHPAIAGSASGVVGTTQMGIGALAAFTIAPFDHTSPLATIVQLALCAILATAGAWLALKTDRRGVV